ncbi:uncharacterized protein BCR38DRAFT_63770 [Pseudomassariella vexata]|uniref:PHD-type domain-containing protein n=1 Tax=Pseudomassariella vexata TaxID=1141098 RepID=A0A1Y2DJW8_9PEZI|nr:uncharacterized protein BCR38DRAFT_63770 [Pseudomassariella vexata]ORY59075.1 hypothetical protein BCR38DRAFT_63770 [Pseudomassariella vexata]
MPASSNIKPTARSRFSSPLHLSASSPSSHNKGLSTEGQRTFMQRWLEPPVQNKASFQEAGLMRAGVVENMAPLGTLPKAATAKKTAAPAENTPAAQSVKRIVFKSSARPKTPMEEGNVEQPTAAGPSPPRDTGDATITSPTQPIFPINGLDDEEDEDYMPVMNKARVRRAARIKNATHRPIRFGRRSGDRPQSPVAPKIHSPTQPPTPSLTFQPPNPRFNHKPEDKGLADKVVEAAVEEALSHYRYPTAWALRLLYDENSSDPRFVSMIEDIYHQRADVETLQEFNRLVADKKKEGKKENKGCYYFVPPSTNSRFTPHKPKAAPYGGLLTMDLTPVKEASMELDGHVSKKLKFEGSHGLSHGHSAATPSHVPSSTNGNGLNGVAKGLKAKKSPKGRKHRCGSVSSDSSLSSVPDDMPDNFAEFMDQVDDEDLGVSRPSTSAAEPNNAPTPIPAVPTGPISARQKKPAAKRKNASPKPDPSATQPSHPHDSDMPAAILTNGAAHHRIEKHATGPKSKRDSAAPGDKIFQLKLQTKLQNIGLTSSRSFESFTRQPLAADPLEEELPALAPTEQNRSVRTPVLTLRAARAAKRHHDDADQSSSPTALSFRADFEPSSARDSRAGTPSNLRSTRKQRSGVRVKNSPMKKKGTAAGVPRGSGERPSPVGNGASNDRDDNDDSCYTCGGNGELVCCDGCHYSFHFLCIDPPMDESLVPDKWYCNECRHVYFPDQFTGHRGAFSSLLDNLDKKNPRAFRLPQDIREHFEGVRTGADGEYEEMTAIGKPKVNKKGYDEPFDFFKVRNAEGNAVLCHQCHQGTTDNRPIIPCSVCGLNWHLECLTPPLTIPPVLRTWRCPCHVDDMLTTDLGPAHKYRKLRHASIIEQTYSRGMTNNGYIEVEEDSTDDEALKAFENRNDYGHVYRIPESGIKRDFLSRVHNNRRQALRRSHASNPALSVAPQAPTIAEQQAALNLSQLASDSGVNQLVKALISQASPAVVAMIAQGDAQRIATGDLSAADEQALRVMLLQMDAVKTGIIQLLESRQPKTTQDGKLTPAPPAALVASQSIENDSASTVSPTSLNGNSLGMTVKQDRQSENFTMEVD